MNALNMPSEETFLRVATALERQVQLGEIVDRSGLPGSDRLLAGTRHAGFLGFVPASQFKTGAQIATDIGLSAGTLQNTDTPWIKYIWKGKICFTPLKSVRHSVPWDAIYNAGAVYGTDDYGLLPPTGRLGESIWIDGADNSINTTGGNFLGDKTAEMLYADTVGQVGDVLVLAGWTTTGNNGEATITNITNTKIKVSGLTLASEQGGGLKRFYNKAKRVLQSASTVVNNVSGRVRLMKGYEVDAFNYNAANRNCPGKNNEWNWIILQLHEHAKFKNWIYPQYVDSDLGDFGVYLTDKDLVAHNQYGYGSYKWTQEVCLNGVRSHDRALRGYAGASYANAGRSWNSNSASGFPPVVEFTQTATL